MATRLYLHNALSGVSGTLPSTEQSYLTTEFDTDAQNINRSMTKTIGSLQASKSISIADGTTDRIYYVTRFVSDPLNAQTISAGSWTISFAVAVNDLNANFPSTFNGNTPLVIYLWRPTTGAKVGDIYNTATNSGGFGEPSSTNTETSCYGTSTGGSSVIAQSGDVLCFEVIFAPLQASGTGRIATYYYDGTTVETSSGVTVSSIASFIETSQDITFTTDPPAFIDMTNSSTKTIADKYITKV